MIYAADDLRLHIRSTLKLIGKWNPDREEIILATAAHESHLGEWMTQLGGGPAVGVFGMEPATEYDRWKNYLSYRMRAGELGNVIAKLTGIDTPTPSALVSNLSYAICMCCVKYMSCPFPLPSASDLQGMADYWWKEYNGNPEDRRPQFMTDYRRLILGLTLPGD
jgi:hypothetical protein